MDCAYSLDSLIQRSDFGCGFLVFGCFSQVFNLLGLFLMFFLGLIILRFGFGFGWRGLVQLLCDLRGRLSHINDGLASKIGFGEACDAKIMSSKCGPLKLLEKKSQHIGTRAKDVLEIDYDDKEYCGEDLEFNVMALRRLVDIETQRASMACMELENERMAAASAANEAMAMILRLQNEKSATEIESNQYRRLAVQKQEFDKEVIHSLQWLVMKLESEKILLEDKLMSFRQKLKQYMKDDELAEFEGIYACLEDDVDDEVISSVDLDSSVL